MGLSAKNQTLAAHFIQLKADVKAEMQRRCRSGSLIGYAGTDYDYTVEPIAGGQALIEHINKIIEPMNAISSTGIDSNQAVGSQIKELESIQDKLDAHESIAMGYGVTSDCAAGCSGLCSSGCWNSCSGCGGACSNSCSGTCDSTCSSCSADCASGCSNTCSGTCSGTCSTCANNCSSCGGSCSSDCTGGCSGECYGSCSGGCYTGCQGTCQGKCTTTCTGTLTH